MSGCCVSSSEFLPPDEYKRCSRKDQYIAIMGDRTVWNGTISESMLMKRLRYLNASLISPARVE